MLCDSAYEQSYFILLITLTFTDVITFYSNSLLPVCVARAHPALASLPLTCFPISTPTPPLFWGTPFIPNSNATTASRTSLLKLTGHGSCSSQSAALTKFLPRTPSIPESLGKATVNKCHVGARETQERGRHRSDGRWTGQTLGAQ